MSEANNLEGNKQGKKYKRLDVDEYFLKIVSVVAERSTCLRHHVGAIAVKDRRILATGYNGAPSGAIDCLALGCMRNQLNIPSGERHEICRAVHAEQNVIIQAALCGASLEGATLYSTHTPCTVCAKMLVNAKIKRFVSYGKYNPSSQDAWINMRAFNDLFKESNISLEIKDRPDSTINFLD
jgi:dCMP deaminase